MKVILHNDDFGLTYGFTEAIKDSYLKNVITSTSIRTNGMAYKYARSLLKTKLRGIGLGLHLNLVDGKPHTLELTNSQGKYKFNFAQYLVLSLYNKNILRIVEKELDCQFKIALKGNIKMDHVSGHNHTYSIPAIFEIVCRLCKKYNIRSIRLPNEPYYLTNSIKDLLPLLNLNLVKFLILKSFNKQNSRILKIYKLQTTDAFYGVLHTGDMNYLTIEKALGDAKKRGYEIIEILGHSAYKDPRDKTYTSKVIKNYVNSNKRRIETQTFQSKQLKDLLSRVTTITYRDL